MERASDFSSFAEQGFWSDVSASAARVLERNAKYVDPSIPVESKEFMSAVRAAVDADESVQASEFFDRYAVVNMDTEEIVAAARAHHQWQQRQAGIDPHAGKGFTDPDGHTFTISAVPRYGVAERQVTLRRID